MYRFYKEIGGLFNFEFEWVGWFVGVGFCAVALKLEEMRFDVTLTGMGVFQF